MCGNVCNPIKCRAFAEGWCVVVVDITVYNDDAAMLIGENSNHDPHVFRADSLLNIADCIRLIYHVCSIRKQALT